jgi:hypothetical protein
MCRHCDWLLWGTVAQMRSMLFDYVWKCYVMAGFAAQNYRLVKTVAESNMKG